MRIKKTSNQALCPINDNVSECTDKNERIALIELIKNFTMRMPLAKVIFQGFGNNYKIEPDSGFYY